LVTFACARLFGQGPRMELGIVVIIALLVGIALAAVLTRREAAD
jgi:hypothetical protein